MKWSMLQNTDELWVRIYTDKYLKNHTIIETPTKKYNLASSAWRAINAGSELLTKGLIWRIGSGEKTIFWHDRWAPCGLLHNMALQPQNVDPDTKVAQLLSFTGWNIDELQRIVQPGALDHIVPVPTRLQGTRPDRPVWESSNSGLFRLARPSKFSGIAAQFGGALIFGRWRLLQHMSEHVWSVAYADLGRCRCSLDNWKPNDAQWLPQELPHFPWERHS